jgi:predicted dehydrogenase
MLSIVFGHLIDSFAEVLGELTELTATVATRRDHVLNIDTGEQVPMTAEDQIAVAGTLTSGAVATIHLRGGTARTTNLLWEINGTEGDLLITGAGGSLSSPLTIRAARGSDEPAELAVPERYDHHPDLAGQPGHAVAHAYDRIRDDLTTGTHHAPDFAQALRRHQLLDHVQRAATEGTRHRLSVSV